MKVWLKVSYIVYANFGSEKGKKGKIAPVMPKKGHNFRIKSDLHSSSLILVIFMWLQLVLRPQN